MRRVVLAVTCVVAAAFAAAGAGCGAQPRAAQSAAAPLTARAVWGGNVPRVRPVDFRAPTRRYRRHVRATLGAMLGDVARLHTATAAGDVGAARAAWLAADERYEQIGAAYGAFGALDARINGRRGSLHRVERALWARRSAAAARPAAAALARDVGRLRARVATLRIAPLDYALRAHEVLEDTLHLALTGQTSPWSGSALVALRGNLRGTRVVLGTLRALLERRNPAIVQRADRALAELGRALVAQERRGGALPRWDRVALRDRERLAALTAAAAERLAFVPELVDPRPPRAVQRAFGDQEAR